MEERTTILLSSGEHDDLWRKVFKGYVPSISKSLMKANAIQCYKELHKLGVYDDLNYADLLSALLDDDGFCSPSSKELIEWNHIKSEKHKRES